MLVCVGNACSVFGLFFHGDDVPPALALSFRTYDGTGRTVEGHTTHVFGGKDSIPRIFFFHTYATGFSRLLNIKIIIMIKLLYSFL